MRNRFYKKIILATLTAYIVALFHLAEREKAWMIFRFEETDLWVSFQKHVYSFKVSVFFGLGVGPCWNG